MLVVSINSPQSPIADLEHPFATSLAIALTIDVIDSAECKSIFELGD